MLLAESQESLNVALGNLNNPFQKLAETIFDKSKSYIQTGNNINPLYLPKLISHIKKCMKLVPLWSGIMIPIFGYGNETASSAAVESSFKKLKNVTFKNIVLPTDIELFLEHHITSLRGMSLLKSNHSLSPKDTIIQNNNDIYFNKDNLPLYDENETNKQSSPTYDNSRHSDENKSPPYEKTNTAKINLPIYYPDSHSDDIDDNSPRYEELDLDRGSSSKNVYTYSDSGDSPPHKNSYLSK